MQQKCSSFALVEFRRSYILAANNALPFLLNCPGLGPVDPLCFCFTSYALAKTCRCTCVPNVPNNQSLLLYCIRTEVKSFFFFRDHRMLIISFWSNQSRTFHAIFKSWLCMIIFFCCCSTDHCGFTFRPAELLFCLSLWQYSTDMCTVLFVLPSGQKRECPARPRQREIQSVSRPAMQARAPRRAAGATRAQMTGEPPADGVTRGERPPQIPWSRSMLSQVSGVVFRKKRNLTLKSFLFFFAVEVCYCGYRAVILPPTLIDYRHGF